MDGIFEFANSVRRDAAVEEWLSVQPGEVGVIAQRWFEVLRDCGDDVRELLHDGHPTACVGTAAFAYVNAFKAHVNIGFFRGAELADPGSLLEGSGKVMRHVKIKPGVPIDDAALGVLIGAAYRDMKTRVRNWRGDGQ